MASHVECLGWTAAVIVSVRGDVVTLWQEGRVESRGKLGMHKGCQVLGLF
jgi:hypothetical protein